MFDIGSGELLLILVVALLLFGPQKLPELGKSLGRAIREFKRATQELQETIEREVEDIKRTATVEPPAERPSGALPAPSYRPPAETATAPVSSPADQERRDALPATGSQPPVAPPQSPSPGTGELERRNEPPPPAEPR
ncbi:MAG: twin-arginine translocase TatA/TatE family subunit [Acidobacteriota bacterium]